MLLSGKKQSALRDTWAVRIKQKVCWLSISCHFNIKTMQMYGECKCAKLSSKMVSNGFVHSLQSPWCIEKQNNAKFCNMKVKIYVCIKSMPSLNDGNDYIMLAILLFVLMWWWPLDEIPGSYIYIQEYCCQYIQSDDDKIFRPIYLSRRCRLHCKQTEEAASKYWAQTNGRGEK